MPRSHVTPVLRLLLASCVCAALAHAAPSSSAQESARQMRQLQNLRQKRAHFQDHSRIPAFQRQSRGGGGGVGIMDQPDPALQGLSTEELYRMIELLDLVKAGHEEKMNSEDLKMLEYLMTQFQQ